MHGAFTPSRGSGGVPVCGEVQARPQPEKQHLWSPGQSLSSAQRLGHAAVPRRARFRGQRPGLAAGGQRLREQLGTRCPPSTPVSLHSDGGLWTRGFATRHLQPRLRQGQLRRPPSIPLPRRVPAVSPGAKGPVPHLAVRAGSVRSSCGCSTSPQGRRRCRCCSSPRSSPRWGRHGGSSLGSLQGETLGARRAGEWGSPGHPTGSCSRQPPAPHRSCLAVPVAGRRQARTSPRRQHFSAPGQLWSERQYSLLGRGGLLPAAGHSPALPGAGGVAGSLRPRGARRGRGPAVGAAPWSPARGCWAGEGGSSTHRARSTSTRVPAPGIMMLGGAVLLRPANRDLNPAGWGLAKMLRPVGVPGGNNLAWGRSQGSAGLLACSRRILRAPFPGHW